MADYKGAVRVDSSSLIRPGVGNSEYVSFASMRGPEDLSMQEASAPAFHRNVLGAIKASGKVSDSDVMEHVIAPRLHTQKKLGFGVGASVKDKTKRKRGTIIAAAVGHTKKSFTPCHRICDSNGDSWIAKETDLKLIY